MSHDTIDIAIVGAGPAGVSTALFLSRAGIKHTLFEKETFPRDKICGDALSGKTVSILKRLDPSYITTLENSDEFLESWGVRFVAPNGKALDIPFKKDPAKQPHAPGFLAPRLTFDQFLVKQLDASMTDFRQATPVNRVERAANGVKLHFSQNGTAKSVTARIVVGAGGDRSLIRDKLTGYKMDRRYYCAGLRAYFENVGGMHDQNFIELHFLKEILPGYLWVFPLPGNRVNVGIGMLSGSMKNKQISLKKVMLNALKENHLIRDRFKEAKLVDDIKGWGLPLGSVKRNLSGERFLLTGDAASGHLA
jgi:geranylgeranyl reductase family protein